MQLLLVLVLGLLAGSANAGFVPIGDGGGKKQTCPEDWSITGVDEWIQGESTLDAGALTMVFFFSQSCHICHDVAPNLQKMYKKLRSRGLQIIAVHSTPKGYKAKDKDVAALKEWVEETGLEFSIVDTHSKEGEQPENPDGTPDYAAASNTPTDPDSLWNKLAKPDQYTPKGWDAQPYGVPNIYVIQNCNIVATTGGYQINDLEKALKGHWDKLLWPGDGSESKKKKRKRKAKKDL